MAILNGILKKLNGSAGSLTFKQVNGQTVVSEKPSTVRNSRTPSQQRQRTKWGNVVQMYKGICPLINYGFESKPVGCSDYNMFMKTNMKLTDIYLTRQEVAGGGCIAAPYQITQGSLPSIVTSGEGDDYVVPFFEKRIEGLNVTYVDMHGIYCKCREVMDTFDWEYFDLIFYASW